MEYIFRSMALYLKTAFPSESAWNKNGLYERLSLPASTNVVRQLSGEYIPVLVWWKAFKTVQFNTRFDTFAIQSPFIAKLCEGLGVIQVMLIVGFAYQGRVRSMSYSCSSWNNPKEIVMCASQSSAVQFNIVSCRYFQFLIYGSAFLKRPKQH